MKKEFNIIKQEFNNQNQKNIFYIEDEKRFIFAGGGGQDKDEIFIKLYQNNKTKDIKVDDFTREKNIVKLEVNLNNQNKLELEKLNSLYIIIDESKRNELSRTHSAEHLLMSQILNFSHQKNIEIKLNKVQIERLKGKVFIETKTDKKTIQDILFNAEKQANLIIKKGKKIIEHIYTKDRFDELINKFPELRIKKDRLKDDFVRIIEIEGIDYSACMGTHLSNTNEINFIAITSIKSYKNKGYEIEFGLEIAETLNLKNKLLCFIQNSDLNLDNFEKNYENILQDKENYRKIINELSPLIFNLSKKINFNHKNIDFLELENFDSKILFKIIKDKDNFMIINKLSSDSYQIISKSIDLSFIKEYKGKLSQEKTIIIIDSKQYNDLREKIIYA